MNIDCVIKINLSRTLAASMQFTGRKKASFLFLNIFSPASQHKAPVAAVMISFIKVGAMNIRIIKKMAAGASISL